MSVTQKEQPRAPVNTHQHCFVLESVLWQCPLAAPVPQQPPQCPTSSPSGPQQPQCPSSCSSVPPAAPIHQRVAGSVTVALPNYSHYVSVNKHQFPNNGGSRASAPAGPSNHPAAPGRTRPDRSAPGRAPPRPAAPPETGSDTEHRGTWGTQGNVGNAGGHKGTPGVPGAEPTRCPDRKSVV